MEINTVLNGDCLELIKNIKKNSIDLILTDPPYHISKKSNFHVGNKKFKAMVNDFGYWDYVDNEYAILFKEFYRVLKKSGTLIFFWDIWKANYVKTWATDACFKQPRIGQWIKTNPTPINSKSNYLSNAIEFFFTFTKVKTPTFNSSYDNGIYKHPLCHGKERLDHPTQKPLQLIRDLVKKHSNEGDIILDPFSGTGTLAEAAILESRNFICVEKDLNYWNLSDERIKKLL